MVYRNKYGGNNKKNKYIYIYIYITTGKIEQDA